MSIERFPREGRAVRKIELTVAEENELRRLLNQSISDTGSNIRAIRCRAILDKLLKPESALTKRAFRIAIIRRQHNEQRAELEIEAYDLDEALAIARSREDLEFDEGTDFEATLIYGTWDEHDEWIEIDRN